MGQWGAYVQGSNFQNLENLDLIGRELSLRIDCPVHYPAWDKPVFECKHLTQFPMFALKEAVKTNDWDYIVEHHTLSL